VIPVGDVGTQTLAFSKRLVRLDSRKWDIRRGVLNGALVVAPLVVGFSLGLAVPSVLVTVGALNLLLVETPFPGRTAGRVLLVAAATNALAFGAGSLVATLPRFIELPFVGAGMFLALWTARSRDWEPAGSIAAVMFAFAVGVPPASAMGLLERPLAVLIGGVWIVSALAVLYSIFPQRPADFFELRPTAPTLSRPTEQSTTEHCLAVGVTGAIGLLIGIELGLPRDYWVLVTVLVALRPDLATTLAYSSARIVGTVLGAGVAFAVTTLSSSPWVLFPILFGTATLAYITRSVSYVVYSLGITVAIIVLLNLAYSGGPALAVTRIVDTLIGGGLAMAAALVLARGLTGPAHLPASAGRP
jgi:uncharacterized membrane protein YccC